MKKGIITALACAFMVMAIPFSVKADQGEPIQGSPKQQYAAPMDNAEQYYESHVDEKRDYYYKFLTGAQDGIYLVALESIYENPASNGTVTVQIMDNYGTVVDSLTAGGAGANYKMSSSGKSLYSLLPVSGLNKNTWYYIRVNSNDGDAANTIEMATRITQKFVSFLPADGFAMKYGSGNLELSWNNVQTANKYDSLKSFDGFQLELNANNVTRVKDLGNGGVNKYTLSTSDPDLIALGYPNKSVRLRLGCFQTFHSVFETNFTVRKCVFSNNIIFTDSIVKKTQTAVSGLKYKVTNNRTDGNGTVSVIGLEGKSPKTVKIGATVNIKGINYKITTISKKAFAGNKTIKNVEIGANVKTIGESAFDGCSSLKKVKIKSEVLKKIGKRAMIGVNGKVKVICPNKTIKKKVKKLLKNKIVPGVKYST